MKTLIVLSDINCDIVYLPEVSDLYNENEKVKKFQFSGLDKYMEGKGRQGILMGLRCGRKTIQNSKSKKHILVKRIFNNFKLLNI